MSKAARLRASLAKLREPGQVSLEPRLAQGTMAWLVVSCDSERDSSKGWVAFVRDGERLTMGFGARGGKLLTESGERVVSGARKRDCAATVEAV